MASVPATGRADSDAPAWRPVGVAATEEEARFRPTAATSVHVLYRGGLPRHRSHCRRRSASWRARRHAGRSGGWAGPPTATDTPGANRVALKNGQPTAFVWDPAPRQCWYATASASPLREASEPSGRKVVGPDLEWNSAAIVEPLTACQAGAAPKVPPNRTQPTTVPRSPPIGGNADSEASVTKALSRSASAPP